MPCAGKLAFSVWNHTHIKLIYGEPLNTLLLPYNYPVSHEISKTSHLKTISVGCHLYSQPVKINFPPIKNMEWFTYMHKNRPSKIDAIQSSADASSLPNTLNLQKVIDGQGEMSKSYSKWDCNTSSLDTSIFFLNNILYKLVFSYEDEGQIWEGKKHQNIILYPFTQEGMSSVYIANVPSDLSYFSVQHILLLHIISI